MNMFRYRIERVTWNDYVITADLYDAEHRVNIEVSFHIHNRRRFVDFRHLLQRHQILGDLINVHELITIYELYTGVTKNDNS